MGSRWRPWFQGQWTSPCPHCLSLLQHQWLNLTAEAAASDVVLLLSTSPPNPSWHWFYTLRARHSWVKELSQREMAILLIHFRHLLAVCEPTAKADTQIAPHTHRVLTSWVCVVRSGGWAARSVKSMSDWQGLQSTGHEESEVTELLTLSLFHFFKL